MTTAQAPVLVVGGRLIRLLAQYRRARVSPTSRGLAMRLEREIAQHVADLMSTPHHAPKAAPRT